MVAASCEIVQHNKPEVRVLEVYLIALHCIIISNQHQKYELSTLNIVRVHDELKPDILTSNTVVEQK
jgi:hypothetical protein